MESQRYYSTQVEKTAKKDLLNVGKNPLEKLKFLMTNGKVFLQRRDMAMLAIGLGAETAETDNEAGYNIAIEAVQPTERLTIKIDQEKRQEDVKQIMTEGFYHKVTEMKQVSIGA